MATNIKTYLKNASQQNRDSCTRATATLRMQYKYYLSVSKKTMMWWIEASCSCVLWVRKPVLTLEQITGGVNSLVIAQIGVNWDTWAFHPVVLSSRRFMALLQAWWSTPHEWVIEGPRMHLRIFISCHMCVWENSTQFHIPGSRCLQLVIASYTEPSPFGERWFYSCMLDVA